MHKLELDQATRSNRKPWSWTPLNKARAADILGVFNELEKFWPITERHAYYRLISSDRINQDHWCCYGNPKYPKADIYTIIGRVLKWMRIFEMLPWKALTDDHRITTPKRGFSDMDEFIDAEVDALFEGYQRCTAQKQDNYLEVWIEKAGLLRIVKPIVDSFCRRVVVCKGYNSVSFQAEFYQRATEAMNAGQTPLVLYFGDWDPSGVNMIYAAMQTLADELDLYGVEYHRCGINPEHFNTITASPVPIKPKDSRYKEFIKQHGNIAYELDAFHPEKLQYLVAESIMAFTNMDEYKTNKFQESCDKDDIYDLKQATFEFITDRLAGV